MHGFVQFLNMEILLWDNCSIKDSKILEDLQVEAARIIIGLRHNTSRSKLYDELGWDLFSTRRIIHKLIHLYKIVNGFVPQYLCDLLEPFYPRSCCVFAGMLSRHKLWVSHICILDK